MTALSLFGSTMLVVFLLGMQSLLVNNGRYLGAFVNSFGIGLANLVLFKLAPDATGLDIIAFVSGGPLGIVLAMYARRDLHRRPAEKEELSGRVA